MNARLIVAFAVILVVARAAAAQDIEELKKKYKNMPGGDAIVAALEAHRAEIEAAQGKQKAQMAKLGFDKPAKSAKELLGMIPALPKTVAEARARRGKVEDGNGRKVDGDSKSAAAVHELYNALNASARAQNAAPPPSAGIVRDNEGASIKKLSEQSRALATEAQAAGLKFRQATQAEDQALTKRLDALSEAVHKKLGDGSCDSDGEGQRLSPAQKAKCKAIGDAYLADVNKARGAFLGKLNALAGPYRESLQGWVGRGATIEAEAAAIKSPALQSPASMYGSQTRTALLQALADLESADSSAVLRASEKDPVVF